ncbi:phosphatidate cytidylyltransferase [Citrobacter sp. JGM124]|uniref:phosphatidate cytidylyltransferase n=1 Tax=Citrobacter sp. JGM124 TaxID=2799789 RepID=UPI001BA8F935|nr:phosphatidate cytidylyltransferase [Citrobacter sp. JGM124]MBS0846764.1 phosphatidate cytidylyltransferase [Citrobacter sp. JGM124]
MNFQDQALVYLLAGLLGVLICASGVGFMIEKARGSSPVIINMNTRIRTWWVMILLLVAAVWAGPIGAPLLFAIISLLVLRESITLRPAYPGDHDVLFWCFFILLPLQYVLVGMQWYGALALFIPVYAFLFIPTRIALAGDSNNFLERSAKIQWGMILAVYCISHIPALLILPIPGYEHQNIKLLLFLMIVIQTSDVMQYVFGNLMGKRSRSPRLNPNKTVGGFIGGLTLATLTGTLLWWVTPFAPWQAALISLMITLLGFAGGLCISAIRRERGEKNVGTTNKGQGGMIDRIDSLCFAAPVFFHFVRFWFT